MGNYQYNFEAMMEKYAGAKEFLVPSAEAVQSLYLIPEGKALVRKEKKMKRSVIYAAAAALVVLLSGIVVYCSTRVTKSDNEQQISLAEEETEETEENTQKRMIVSIITEGMIESDAASADIEVVSDDAEESTEVYEVYTEEDGISVQHYAIEAGEVLYDSFDFDETYIYPDDFSGCYIDYDTLYVLVTSEDAVSYYEELLADYTDFVVYEIAEYSYNELSAERDKIWNALTAEEIYPIAGYVDQEENSVEIEVNEADYEKALEVLAEMEE